LSVIDLYYYPGAASLVVHTALEEAGAEHNLIRATREDGVFGPAEAARLNPHGGCRRCRSTAWR
jgi:glutathione S-transferase